MVRVLFLGAAIISIPLGAYLFDFRSSPVVLKEVVFVSAVAPETQTNTETEIDLEVAELVRRAEEAAISVASLTPGAQVKEAILPRPKPRPDTVSSNVIETPKVKLTVSKVASASTAASAPKKSIEKLILSNFNVTGNNIERGQKSVETLELLIQRSLARGRTDEFGQDQGIRIASTIANQPTKTSAYLGPKEMLTASGQVDMQALLMSLVERSDLAAQGGFASATGTLRVATKTTTISKDQIHVVKPGDSLAAIAYRYYGRTGDYLRIFKANKTRLNSINSIQVGQELVIPAL